MAGTFTNDAVVPNGTTMGNLKVVMGILDAADGAGEAVDTKLESIAGFSITPKSCATGGGQLFTKTAGTITPATCDSADTFYVVAWGI